MLSKFRSMYAFILFQAKVIDSFVCL